MPPKVRNQQFRHICSFCRKIQKSHQNDTDKRENQNLVSMLIYSSPLYETIPADMISPDEATGDYALVNDKEFTW